MIRSYSDGMSKQGSGSYTPNEELVFRRAQPGDVVELQRLYVEVCEWIHTAHAPIKQWRVDSFTLESVTAMIDEKEAYIAQLDGMLAGCFFLQWELDPVWGDLYHDDSGYVHRLAVSRGLKGRQVGSRMLDWAEAHIRSHGKSWLRLDCMADNPALNQYYLGLGMTYRGRVEAGRWSASLYERRCRDLQMPNRTI